VIADLSSRESIRSLAQEFRQKYDKLHVLVNNAGGVYKRLLSVDGVEMNLAVNYFVSFMLTNLLIDSLITGGGRGDVQEVELANLYGRDYKYSDADVRAVQAFCCHVHVCSGAQTTLYLAASPQIEGVMGKYFVNCKEKLSVPISYNEELQESIWRYSTELTGVDEEIGVI
jgi:hypothetical protein